MDLIQKLPMFVSHMYIVVMHLTAVYLHTCTNMTFCLGSRLEMNQVLACQVIKAQIVPLLDG